MPRSLLMLLLAACSALALAPEHGHPPHRTRQVRPPPERRTAPAVLELPPNATTTTTEPDPTTTTTTAVPAPEGWSGPWACIAQHESGGNPSEDTGNGYYGGLQFSVASWAGAGGPPGLPSEYPISVQEAVAERLLAMQGWGAWPNTSRMCGYE